MHIVACIVTRSASLAVKTLHTLLSLNRICAEKGHSLEISFVNDELFERKNLLIKKLKHCDRIIWVNYSVYVDQDSIRVLTDKFINGYSCVVTPCVTPGIDWDMFKKKVKDGTKEPLYQMGLNFDTEVGKSIGENFHVVTSTTPQAWACDTKPMLKALKGNKGEGINISANVQEMFKTLIERGLKVYAFTAANLIITYPHECIGNLLSAAGVETSKI
jgi:hypothetical protein